jgi:hypothetical protein
LVIRRQANRSGEISNRFVVLLQFAVDPSTVVVSNRQICRPEIFNLRNRGEIVDFGLIVAFAILVPNALPVGLG